MLALTEITRSAPRHRAMPVPDGVREDVVRLLAGATGRAACQDLCSGADAVAAHAVASSSGCCAKRS